MRGLLLTDIGPIPDSEVERLEPFVIDHTVLQRQFDGSGEEATKKKKKGKGAGGKKKGKK